jgi:hypothetical protein
MYAKKYKMRSKYRNAYIPKELDIKPQKSVKTNR